ncbi:hypothetical protein [Streptomyces sp. NPDC059247]|uniref:hypothetical protein n=1 Tax=Streptomyces sp. NPDC059247 TaxID=3346790 RepID=UPI00367B82A7
MELPSPSAAQVQQTGLWLIEGGRPFAALAAGALATLTNVRTVMLTSVLVLLLSATALRRSPVRHLTTRDEGDLR